MRWSVGLIFICVVFADPGPSLQRVYVRDLATDKPVVDLTVTVRHDEITTKLTTGKGGMLELPAGTNVRITSDDPAWRILPAKVHVDDDLVEIAAHRYITVSGILRGTVRGTVGGGDIKHIEDANIFATFLDATGKNPIVCSGGPLVGPLGLRTLWRAGIPNTNGEFKLRVPMIPGVAIFARHREQFASVRRLALEDRVTMDLPLQKELLISGNVVDTDGKPVHGAHVRAITVVGSRDGWLPDREMARRCPGAGIGYVNMGSLRMRFADYWIHFRTPKDGSFRLASATDGDFRVVVGAKGFKLHHVGLIRLTRSLTKQRIVLERANGAVPVEVTIDGKTRPRAEIAVWEYLPPDPVRKTFGAIDSWSSQLDDKGRMRTEWLRAGHSYNISHWGDVRADTVVTWPVKGPIALLSGNGPKIETRVEIK